MRRFAQVVLLAVLIALQLPAASSSAGRRAPRDCQAPGSQPSVPEPSSPERSGAAPAPAEAPVAEKTQVAQVDEKPKFTKFRGRRYPLNLSAAAALRSAGRTFTNGQIRRFYKRLARQLPKKNERWVAAGKGAAARARLAYDWRKNARLVARAMMGSEDEVAALRARDVKKYGQPDGPTFEQLVEKARARGLEGEALYEGVVSSARRTNKKVDRRMNPAEGSP